jgi:predicted nucleic acid-binding protein
MLLVDTTVWVDYFLGSTTLEAHYLTTAILERKNICLCGAVLTEILQGISNSKEYNRILSMLRPLIFIEMTQETFILSANIYRKLRMRGFTIRKTIDCMIAAVALENNIPLLHHDRDFDPIERYCQLEVIKF